ncbi:SLC13 family permease [Vreelandella venusta]|uniref:SLC13 family permease n=1 Tax=Vreelandella venusta TaxID=44935 RepID=UPI00384F641A
MTPWAVLLSITVLLALLISGKVKPAIAFVTLAGGYLLVRVIDTGTLLAQYTNPALATLLLLLLISLALERSSLLGWLSQHLLKGHPKLATAQLMGCTAVLSAFLNNTAVVAAFLGAITRQQNIALSRLLIPLSYASSLGGITRLVGTSTNLVVSSFHPNASGS